MLFNLLFDNKYNSTVLFSKIFVWSGVFKSLFPKGMKMVQEVAMVVSTGQELDMPFQEGKEFLQMAKILI